MHIQAMVPENIKIMRILPNLKIQIFWHFLSFLYMRIKTKKVEILKAQMAKETARENIDY